MNNLLPPEGDFQAIIIDALGGDDQVTVGPTVQKTVWIDAGPGEVVGRLVLHTSALNGVVTGQSTTMQLAPTVGYRLVL